MKRFLWGLWFGVGNGIRAGVIFILTYVCFDEILQMTILDLEYSLIIVHLLYGFAFSIILGALLGGMMGSILAIPQLTQYSAIIGMVAGGVMGFLIGLKPFGLWIDNSSMPLAEDFYSVLTRLVAILLGGYVGYASGTRLYIALHRKSASAISKGKNWFAMQ